LYVIQHLFNKSFIMSKKKLNIGDRIRELAEKKFRTNEEFAHAFGVTPSAVYNWFRGEDMKTSRAIEIAEFFNVSVHFLMTGEEPMLYAQEHNEGYKVFDRSKVKVKGDQNFFPEGNDFDYKSEYHRQKAENLALQEKYNQIVQDFQKISLALANLQTRINSGSSDGSQS
jgi:transcriptional regulator with XRE-family HTH domain